MHATFTIHTRDDVQRQEFYGEPIDIALQLQQLLLMDNGNIEYMYLDIPGALIALFIANTSHEGMPGFNTINRGVEVWVGCLTWPEAISRYCREIAKLLQSYKHTFFAYYS